MKKHTFLFLLFAISTFSLFGQPDSNCPLSEAEVFCSILHMNGHGNSNLLIEDRVGCTLEISDNGNVKDSICYHIDFGHTYVMGEKYFYIKFWEEDWYWEYDNGTLVLFEGGIGLRQHLLYNCESDRNIHCATHTVTGSLVDECFEPFTLEYLDFGALDLNFIKYDTYSTLEELPCDDVNPWNLFVPSGGYVLCSGDCDSTLVGVTSLGKPAELEISVSPNPTSDQINIETSPSTDPQDLTFLLIDSFGRQIPCMLKGDEDIGTASTQLNLSACPPGLYFLRINIKGQSNTFKIIKL